MSVAVIGGCGFVGLNIVEALLSRGATVNLLDTIEPPLRALEMFAGLPGRCRVNALDVRDAQAMASALSHPDLEAVIYAAAITADSSREARGTLPIVDVNIRGLAHLLDALASRPGVRIVYVGSSAVYGPLPDREEPIKEDWPQRPATLYAITKASAEQMVVRWSSLHGRDAAVARLGWVFGPWERQTGVRDTMSPILQVTKAALADEAVVLPRDATLDWLYARDAGGAIARLALDPPFASGIFNLGPMRRWPISAWCRRLQEIHPQFEWTIGSGAGTAIALYHGTDNAALDATLFVQTYEPLDWHGVDRAFNDYVPRFFDAH